ncbi:MAG: 30S ribosomal protein S6 [Ardenticatenaceae bacterium]|nr:30S ribosomal protein S6 [Ardenticatenaceae bacterium]HBY94319.1 30S ribosomal protein S6 [Chloroflexota bacterium]
MDDRRRYELYAVLSVGLEEDALEALVARLDDIIVNSGGEVLEVKRKGRRRLAYAIHHQNEGYDIVYQLTLPAEAPASIERQLRLQEDVLRYLLLRREDLEKAQPAQPEKKGAS